MASAIEKGEELTQKAKETIGSCDSPLEQGHPYLTISTGTATQQASQKANQASAQGRAKAEEAGNKAEEAARAAASS